MSAATTLALARARRPLNGLGADPSAPGPIARLAKRYWWTMPLAATAIYASYRMRSTGKRRPALSTIAFDTIGALGALASLVALIELEASKTP